MQCFSLRCPCWLKGTLLSLSLSHTHSKFNGHFHPRQLKNSGQIYLKRLPWFTETTYKYFWWWMPKMEVDTKLKKLGSFFLSQTRKEMQEDKTKEITTVKEVCKSDLIIIKFGETFAFNFSKNYLWFEILSPLLGVWKWDEILFFVSDTLCQHSLDFSPLWSQKNSRIRKVFLNL